MVMSKSQYILRVTEYYVLASRYLETPISQANRTPENKEVLDQGAGYVYQGN